ncbi:DNA polymerase Y family protein [Methylococcus sp. EFPC2]|uniref:Y-family DNA polymerase n=1 Tax=Methylococcus sp. EFPC2 TaxID=2812648 RepID=UPI001F086577|nr:DNA polymerase Y family protein [Methylococcus sp. EFPC2]
MLALAQTLPLFEESPPAPERRPEAGRLWLCAHFPDLALEVLPINPARPAATVEERKGRPVIHAVSAGAKQAGVEPGMALAAALALCPGLDIRSRDPMAEREALNRLAETGLDFTPWVSLDQPESLLLEIRASLNLFGGTEKLRVGLRSRLAALGHSPVIAIAPSSEASALLARLGLETTVSETQALRSALGRVPIAALSLDEKKVRRLLKTGVRHLADLWRLPRDGLARRYGSELLRQLDALSGAETRILSAYHCPPRFTARREMPLALERLDHFFPAIEQMTEEFAVFLKARDAAASELKLILHHQGRPASGLELRFRSGNRDASHWCRLLREKLERSPLPAPLIAVELESGSIVPFEPERTDLFGDETAQSGDGRDWQAVLEQLQARLGSHAVQRLAAVADHRPEHALHRDGGKSSRTPGRVFHTPTPEPTHVGWNKRRRIPADRPKSRDSLRSSQPTEENEASAASYGTNSLLSLRPVWLLTEPEPLAAKDIRLLSEAERIESGWWDGGSIRRDYHRATDRRGRRLWVYRDLHDGGWYLHGLYG